MERNFCFISVVPSDYIKSELPIVRNMFENRSAAQTNHRMLAYTTYLTTMIACGIGFTYRKRLPRSVNIGLALTALAVNSQVLLL